MIDYKTVSDSIAETLKKGGEPLNENQKVMITAGLAIWLNKVEKDIIEQVQQVIINA